MKKAVLCELVLLAVLICMPISVLAGYYPAGAVQLPQTGQTTSYYAGDDGAVRAGAARFSDNLNGTITDSRTGLMWTKNANLANGYMSWQQALDYVASLNSGSGVGGFHDWRLPNIIELESLINTSVVPCSNFLINYFLNVQIAYWSSTTYSASTTSAFYLAFGEMNGQSGQAMWDSKSVSFFVWPVRSGGGSSVISLARTGQTTSYSAGDDGAIQAGTAWPSPRFTDNLNGTVTDKLTGLMWTKNANPGGYSMDWQEALTYVNGLTFAGYDDWRAPNINELKSLFDYSRNNPALPQGHPFINFTPDWFWSSTAGVNGFGTYAWIIYWIQGGVAQHSASDYDGYYAVWPVRRIVDFDNDGILDDVDNCPTVPNGPSAGSCYNYYTGEVWGSCTEHSQCQGDPPVWWKWCDTAQNDMDADGTGDVCEP